MIKNFKFYKKIDKNKRGKSKEQILEKKKKNSHESVKRLPPNSGRHRNSRIDTQIPHRMQ